MRKFLNGLTWAVALAIDAGGTGRTDGANLIDPGYAPRLRTTFVDVARTSVDQTIPAGAFTRVTYQSVNKDPGGLWDATNNWYACPRAGIYLVTATLRVGLGGDASGYNSRQYGLGVYTGEQDGPWFLWHCTAPSVGAKRSTYPYSRLTFQQAGDKLRAFTYSDDGIAVAAAGLQIMLVSENA